MKGFTRKVKVKLPLYLIKHAIKIGGGVEGLIHVFITLALNRRERSDSRHSSFAPGERFPGTHEPVGSMDV
jgi:hypothetical protein